MTWDPVPGATGYNVNYTDDHKKSWQRASSNTNVRTATISNTKPGLAYYASVSAVGGAWRDSAAVHSAIPKQVGAITLAWDTDGDLKITWSAPSSGATPTGYDVVVSNDHKYSWIRADTNINPTPQNGSISIKKNFNENLGYHIAIRAVGTYGHGPWRNSARIEPEPLALTERPYITANRGSDFIDVEWDAVTGATGYDIEVFESDKPEDETAYTTTGTTFKITGLSDRTIYVVEVRAYNAQGNGPWDRYVVYGAWTPRPPSSITVNRVGGATTMTVSWAQCAPNRYTDPDCDGISTITGYQIDVKESSASGWGSVEKTLTTYTSGSTISITSLDASKSYHVRVGVTNRMGTSWSSTKGPFN